MIHFVLCAPQIEDNSRKEGEDKEFIKEEGKEDDEHNTQRRKKSGLRCNQENRESLDDQPSELVRIQSLDNQCVSVCVCSLARARVCNETLILCFNVPLPSQCHVS